MDNLLSQMELEVHDMKTKIPCVASSLSMGAETEKILSDVVAHHKSSIHSGPPAVPSSICTDETEEEKGILLLPPRSKNGLWKSIIMDPMYRKSKLLFLLFLLLSVVNFMFPSSLLYSTPLPHDNVPLSTTRIPVRKEFSYFRWIVFTSAQTLLFWGFFKIMQIWKIWKPFFSKFHKFTYFINFLKFVKL